MHKAWATSEHVVCDTAAPGADLRHTCASLLIAWGEHPKKIQEHLGHSSIQVTMDRYGHLFPDKSERLADVLEATYQAALKLRDQPRRLRLVRPPDDE